MPEIKQLNCIVCNKELEPAFPPPIEHNQPYGGTSFTSRGHYGSTVWDPMDGTYLEINICDECLVKAGDEGKVLYVVPKQSVTTFLYKEWNGRHSDAVATSDEAAGGDANGEEDS